MTSGGQCVMTPGTTLMLLWSASNWDIHTLEVSMPANVHIYVVSIFMSQCLVQVVEHTAVLTLVLAVDQSFWMMSNVPQAQASYWNATVVQSCHTTASTLLMLVLGVKVL